MTTELALPGIARTSILAVPERLVDSAWLGHIPFAFWLVDAHRPRVTVELGVHNGASLCAMVQGAKAVGHVGHFHGVDHWVGDEHAGLHETDVYWNLMAFHEARHRDMSSLMRTGFDEAAGHFEDGTVDLIHIDGLHSYEAVRHDFETWLPKASARGVVLFHDTTERREGFGVWRFWAEVAQRHPAFNFNHSHGLGVLYVGSDPIPQWMDHLARCQETTEGDAIRTWFNQLGDAVVLRREMAQAREHAHNVAMDATAQRGRADALERRMVSADRALACANEVVASQARRIQHVETVLRSTEARASELAASLGTERESHATSRAHLSAALNRPGADAQRLRVA